MLVKCIGHVTNSALATVLSKLQPSLMQPLLRRLVFDVPHLADHNKIALKVNTDLCHLNFYKLLVTKLTRMKIMHNFLSNTFIYQLLTTHYEQRWTYYLQTGGQADQSLASEEELYLSRKLFWSLFKALDKKVNHLKWIKHKLMCFFKCNYTVSVGCEMCWWKWSL